LVATETPVVSRPTIELGNAYHSNFIIDGAKRLAASI